MTLEDLQQYILGVLDKAIGIRDEQRIMANTAKRVGGDLVNISEILKILFWDYLDQPVRETDTPKFVALLAGYLASLDFASGLSGYKVGVDAEFETLKLRKWLEAEEYRVNQISLVGDEVILTEGGQIDSVEELDGGHYKCVLREESVRTGELRAGDICLTDFRLETGFRRIMFEITRVNDDGTIEVFPEDPGCPPRPLMTFKRRGNFTDETRQNSIRLSSHDQVIEMLSGVNSYSPTWRNRELLIGRIKDLLPPSLNIPERIRERASVYAANMIASGNFYQVSLDGVTEERVPCFKGLWVAAKAPFYYYDQVTDGYCRYTCIYQGEEGTREEPRFDSDVWQVADGDTTLRMQMYSSTGSFEFWDRLDILFDATVEVHAGSKPVNNLVNEWEWWLETGDETFDRAWKSVHGSRTDTQHVDGATFPTNMQAGSPCRLWCRAKIYNNGKITINENYLNLN